MSKSFDQNTTIFSKEKVNTFLFRSIKETLNHCDHWIRIKGIKLPMNLKHLLKQNRIQKELRKIEGNKTLRIGNTRNNVL